MRVALVYDCLFPLTTGGGERQYRLFAEAYAAAGHDVAYLTRLQWEGTDPPDVPGVAVVPISGASELYDAHGHRRTGPALRFAAGAFRHLLRHRRDYDAVVVSALPVLNVFAVRAALLGARVPVCADFLEVWRPDQWRQYSGPLLGVVASVLQRLAVRASPWASCHSRMNAERLTAQGLRRSPIVSPGLIDAGMSAVAELEPPAPPLVLFVGRHIPDKHVEAIPAALAHARTLIPDLRAVIVGEGPTTTATRAEVTRLGLEDAVDLPGFVSQEELDSLLRGAACLVNPSQREGYGLVVVEACAAGTPVVLVDAPDNASLELVTAGVNGFVAPSLDPQHLGGAIVAAVRGGGDIRRSTRSWFEEAVRTHTAQAAALAILERITAGRPGAGGAA